MNPKYKRILLKLSGEALMGTQKSGLDPNVLESYAKQVKEAGELGVSIGIVIGGGNIFRGAEGLSKGFSRVSGDYMGMLATVINGIALSEFINQSGGKAIVMTAIEMGPVASVTVKQRLKPFFLRDIQ
jgi:uridylate kinase